MAKLMARQTESNLTEAKAIVRAREGDAAGFEHLYRAHCRRVYGVCIRMTKNSADAEDLTQQAFLQLFGKIGTFRGESGFSTWLQRRSRHRNWTEKAPGRHVSIKRHRYLATRPAVRLKLGETLVEAVGCHKSLHQDLADQRPF